MRFDGFIGETYQTRSANANAERCVNLFPEKTGGSGKSPYHYLHTPGLSTFITLANSPIRCLWAGDDRLFVVAGAKYGEILYGGGSPTFQDRGTVVNDGFRAYIYSNGTQLIIVSGGKLYCDNGGAASGANAVQQVNSIAGTYLDGYFISLTPDSNEIRISDLLNGLSWSALEKQARLSSHDRVVGIASDKKNLWLFGKRNIDVWYNSGNSDFPFEPIQGASIRAGTVIPPTIEDVDNSFFFVMEDERGSAKVVRTSGFSLETISTYAIDWQISNTSIYSLCSWSYEENGHPFYVLTEPSGSTSFVYDVREKLWHERCYWTGTGYLSHLGRCHAYTTPGFSGLAGHHFVGSRDSSGRVFKQSMDYFTDAGAAIRRVRQAPHLADNDNWNYYHEFQLDTHVTGTPDIKLKWSDDDGATWSADKTPVLTAPTDAKKRVIWRRLGRSRDRIFAVTLHNISAPVYINDAFLEVEKGTGA